MQNPEDHEVFYEIASTRNNREATTTWLSKQDLNNDNTNRHAYWKGAISRHSISRKRDKGNLALSTRKISILEGLVLK